MDVPSKTVSGGVNSGSPDTHDPLPFAGFESGARRADDRPPLATITMSSLRAHPLAPSAHHAGTPLVARVQTARGARRATFDDLLFWIMLAGFVYALLLDGFLRLSTGISALTPVRDLFPGALLALLGIQWAIGKRRFPRVPLTGLVALFALIVLLQVANPAAVSPQKALVAMRPHLEYVVLFIVAAITLTDVRRLRVLLLTIAVCGAIGGAVGLVQSTLSPTQLSSWGPGYERLISDNNPRAFTDSTGVERVRPPALASDAGGGATVGLTALPAALALVLIASGASRYVAMATVPFIVAGIATSQIRAGVVAAVFVAVIFLILTSARPGGGRTLVALAALAVTAGLASNALFGGSLVTERYDTIAPTKITATFGESRGGSYRFVSRYISDYPLGAGVGTAGPGSSTGASMNVGKNAENAFLFLLLETGIPGLVAMLALYAGVLILGVRLIRPRRYGRDDSIMVAALVSSIAGFALLWISGPVMVGPPFTLFFYTAAGYIAARTVVVRRRHKAGPQSSQTAGPWHPTPLA